MEGVLKVKKRGFSAPKIHYSFTSSSNSIILL